MDVLPDIQPSDVVLRKLLRVKNLRLHVIDNHSRDLQASNCSRVSIKSGRAARSKRQLLGGDYMIPACRDEISTRPAETDFTLRSL